MHSRLSVLTTTYCILTLVGCLDDLGVGCQTKHHLDHKHMCPNEVIRLDDVLPRVKEECQRIPKYFVENVKYELVTYHAHISTNPFPQKMPWMPCIYSTAHILVIEMRNTWILFSNKRIRLSWSNDGVSCPLRASFELLKVVTSELGMPSTAAHPVRVRKECTIAMGQSCKFAFTCGCSNEPTIYSMCRYQTYDGSTYANLENP